MSNAVQAQKGRNPQGQAFIPAKPHLSRSLEATCHTQVFFIQTGSQANPCNAAIT
jgi:hypothetical protein